MGDALHTNGGVTDAREARLAQAGLIAVVGPSALDARTGVMHGPGSTALVTGTSSTAPMRYAVAPHQWVTSRGAANGPYLGALEATQLVDTTAAPPSGQSRIDVIWVKQQDATPGIPSPDASTAPQYGCTQGAATSGTPGKPAIPVGAEELATAGVSAGATATNGSGVVITNSAKQTVARGAPIPVRNQDERDSLTAGGAGFPGLTVRRLDVAGLPTETYDGASRWYRVGDDTDWINLTLASGWSSAGTPAVRRINGVCYYRGEVWGNSGGGELNLLNASSPLAVGFRPVSRVRPVVGAIPGVFAGVFIDTNGTMTLTSARTASPGYALGAISPYPAS